MNFRSMAVWETNKIDNTHKVLDLISLRTLARAGKKGK